ncbi:MAG: ATP-binding protein [Thermodesulfobacteriota bacterium]
MTSKPADPPGQGGPAGQGGGAEERLARLEAQLETYKKTLTEIYELYDKKIEELSLIRRIGDSIRTPLDLETLCQEVVDAVAREITADRLTLLLVEPEKNRLRIRASYDAAEDLTRFFSGGEAKYLPLDQGPAGRAALSGAPVFLASAEPVQDPCGPQEGGPPVSLLFLPLVARDKTVGLFALRRTGDHPFGEDDVRLLTILSDQAATALANVQLFNDLAAANLRLRESEQEARRTSLYLESLLETANDVIFTLDEAGLVTYVNQKAREWGYDKDALLGRPFLDLLARAGSSGTDRLFTGDKEVLEVGIRTASGERRDALLSASEIPGSAGPARLVLARDITERKQLERQLFHSEKLASIGILAAGVAHEVGNPLSAISGYTQILQSGGATSEETKEYLAAIESQAARIQRIIEDLLDYSRPSAGHRAVLDLSEAIKQVLSMLTAQRTFRGLSVEYDLAGDLPPVNMDRDHLAQVLVNIALNAAQAMEGGGRFSVAAARVGEEVEIRLADNGPGIPPEVQDRLFDPFFTTKEAGQGTGLGLAICHRIIESYKGSIRVESRPGQGAAFIIRLPAAEARDKSGS